MAHQIIRSTPAAPSSYWLECYSSSGFEFIVVCVSVHVENNMRDNGTVTTILCARIVNRIHRKLCLVYGASLISEEEEQICRSNMKTKEIVSVLHQKLQSDRYLLVDEELRQLGRYTVKISNTTNYVQSR